jgi:hypothetical protein
MAKLYKFENVFSTENDQFDLIVGMNLAQWMMDKWPEGFGQDCAVYSRAVRDECLIDPLEWEIKEDDLILVVLKMGDPVTVGVTVGLFAVSYLAAKNLEPDVKEIKPESPNNYASGQKNAIRTNQRIPDIVGKVRSYPDVIYPTVEEYTTTGKQKITEFFAIGVGSYDKANARNGDSLLYSDPATTIEYFDPSSEVTTLTGVVEFYDIQNAKDTRLALDYELPSINTDNVTYVGALSLTGIIRINVGAGNTSDLYQSVAVDDVIQLLSTSTTTTNTGQFFYITGKTPETGGNEDIGARTNSAFSTVSETDKQNFAIVPKMHRIEDVTIKFRPTSSGGGGSVSLFDVYAVSGSDNETTLQNHYQYNSVTGRKYIVVKDPSNGQTGCYTLNNSYTSLGSGVYRFSIGEGFSTLTTSIDETVANCDVYMLFDGDMNGPYVTPISDTEEVWLNIEFPQGLIGASDAAATVKLEVHLENTSNNRYKIIDGDDSVLPLSITANTRSAYRVTKKIVLTDHTDNLGNPLASGEYRIYVRKYYDDSENNAAETVLINLAAVKQTASYAIGNITAARVTTEFNKMLERPDTRRFNVEVIRKLPDYMFYYDDPDSIWYGGWQPGGSSRGSGADVADQQWINAFMYRATDTFGLNAAALEVDVAGLQAIQTTLNALDSGEGGEFNYTFDKAISAEDELRLIAKAARCDVYRIGKKIYCARDETKAAITSIFNRRNKSPKGETRSFNFDQSNRRDHVEITFKDAEEGYKTQTFIYPVSGDIDYDASTTTYFNPIKATLDGITNFSQAYRMAIYLYRSDKLQKDSIVIESTDDARVLGINDKILNVDALEYKDLDGELLAYDDTTPSATILTLDRPVFTGLSGTRSIKCRTANGQSVQSFSCTKGANNYKVVVNNTGGTPFVFSLSDGVSKGTLYQFRTASDTTLDEWTVKTIEASDTYTKVTASKYNANVFACDTESIPTKPY